MTSPSLAGRATRALSAPIKSDRLHCAIRLSRATGLSWIWTVSLCFVSGRSCTGIGVTEARYKKTGRVSSAAIKNRRGGGGKSELIYSAPATTKPSSACRSQRQGETGNYHSGAP
jgi:hypothetical protein